MLSMDKKWLPKMDEKTMAILEEAKQGNENAQKYLLDTFKLKVYTYEELDWINFLIQQKKCSLQQALNLLHLN